MSGLLFQFGGNPFAREVDMNSGNRAIGDALAGVGDSFANAILRKRAEQLRRQEIAEQRGYDSERDYTNRTFDEQMARLTAQLRDQSEGKRQEFELGLRAEDRKDKAETNSKNAINDLRKTLEGDIDYIGSLFDAAIKSGDKSAIERTGKSLAAARDRLGRSSTAAPDALAEIAQSRTNLFPQRSGMEMLSDHDKALLNMPDQEDVVDAQGRRDPSLLPRALKEAILSQKEPSIEEQIGEAIAKRNAGDEAQKAQQSAMGRARAAVLSLADTELDDQSIFEVAEQEKGEPLTDTERRSLAAELKRERTIAAIELQKQTQGLQNNDLRRVIIEMFPSLPPEVQAKLVNFLGASPDLSPDLR